MSWQANVATLPINLGEGDDPDAGEGDDENEYGDRWNNTGRPKWMMDADTETQYGDTIVAPLMKSMFHTINTGIVFLTSMEIIFFVAIAIGWLLIYQIDVVGDEIRMQNFAGAFGSITFAVALITNDLVRGAKLKSTARVRLYAGLLDEIDTLKRTLASVRLSVLHEGKRTWKRDTGADDVKAETARVALSHLRELSILLFMMTKYSYQLFQPFDPYPDYQEFIDHDVYVEFDELLRAPIGAKMRSETVTDIFKNAILYMQTHLAHLLTTGVIQDAMYTQVNANIKSISDEVATITRARRIYTPTIFVNLEYFILGFYLLVLIPLEVYSNTENWMILIYPAVLVIYLSEILYGFWLGDPLMRHARFQGAEVLAWRHKLYREINSLLFHDVYIKMLDRINHADDEGVTEAEKLAGRV